MEGKHDPNWNWLLGLLALLLLPALALGRLGLTMNRWWLLGVAAFLSAVTFVAYASDKGRAKSRGWRWPESTLHALEAAGGWPGALVAQRVWRHKTVKLRYQAVFWLIVALHQLLALDYLLGWPMARGLRGLL